MHRGHSIYGPDDSTADVRVRQGAIIERRPAARLPDEMVATEAEFPPNVRRFVPNDLKVKSVTIVFPRLNHIAVSIRGMNERRPEGFLLGNQAAAGRQKPVPRIHDGNQAFFKSGKDPVYFSDNHIDFFAQVNPR